MRFQIVIVGILLLLVATGCRSPYTTQSDKSIRLPAPKSDDIFQYQVLRTNNLSSDQTIFVNIRGQVNRPGFVELPKGSTLLEAVIQAGGFNQQAAFRKLYVTQGGKRYFYTLQQKNDWRTCHCFAWYGEVSDILLENGAEINVPFRPSAW